MWFFTPRYLKDAKHYLSGARKLLRYKEDQLSGEELAHFQKGLQSLKEAIRSRSEEAINLACHDLQGLIDEVAPPRPHAGWRENLEVFLVAVIVAAGVRAYFLQPFRIPTGSMQPTLYGIVGQPMDTLPPNWIVRGLQLVWQGRGWVNLVSEQDDTILAMRERTYLNFFTFTEVLTETTKYTLFSPMAPLRQNFGMVEGRTYSAGDVMARGVIDTGDQVLVDKLSYHFVRPKLGEVFVFKTTGIRRIEATLPRGVQSQHYIKRLAGMPGNLLRIDPPDLFIDGKIPDVPVLLRVMSEENGYRGYSNGSDGGFQTDFLGTPEATFRVPAGSYFALGDNSYNSSDSRNWGAVPENNVTGRGFIVYWPFTKRWGPIQ
jgi:signal peptidase I